MPWESLRGISSKDDYDDGIMVLDKIVNNIKNIYDKYPCDNGNIFAIGEVYKVLDEIDVMLKNLDNPGNINKEIQDKLYYLAAFAIVISQKRLSKSVSFT